MKKTYLFTWLMSVALLSCTKEMTPGYEGENLSDKARIVRDKETKAARLEIAVDGKWKLYSGTSVDAIDFSKPLIEGKGAGTHILSVPDSIRSYFELVTPTGKALLAEVHLPMTGGYNFRDLGGIRTQDGRYVKWGRLFRSDDLHSLTDDDLVYLASIPIKTIVDFRSEDEIKAAPDRVPTTVNASYPYSMNPGNLSDISSLFSMMASGMDTLMQQLNIELVSDTATVNRYRDFFALLQKEENIPLLYHCSAGKDRTGMASALILFALNVDERTILDNYMLSNIYLGDKYAQYIEQLPQLKPLFEVQENYILSGINHIREAHGSVENYLRTVLNVDIEKFRKLYLD